MLIVSMLVVDPLWRIKLVVDPPGLSVDPSMSIVDPLH